jgi:hypothetical protein
MAFGSNLTLALVAVELVLQETVTTAREVSSDQTANKEAVRAS